MDSISGWYLLLGYLFSNGMPHFVFGVAGKKFRSPLGANSSPTVNVIWGLSNFIAGSAIFYWQASIQAPTMIDILNFIAAYWVIVAMFGFAMNMFRGDDL